MKLIKFFLNFILILIGTLSFTVQASLVELSQISLSPLTKTHQSWFMEEFPRGFMAVYQDKTFVITRKDKPIVLGPAHRQDKRKWLIETAQEEFQDYILVPKQGNRGILIHYKDKPIGALLYRMLENEKTIYLAQYFILPEFQKKGIGVHILLNDLPKLHSDYKRYEILARHQNDAAFLLYQKAGFSIGDVAMVQKYDYDPLRYMSFYKIFE